MNDNDPKKIMICTDDSLFLQEYLDKLSAHFQVQTALNLEVANFLLKEWNPQICVIKASQKAAKIVASLREKSPFFKMGIIVVANPMDPGFSSKESDCFKSGADHFIALEADSKPLILRIQSLTRSMRASHEPESNILTASSHSLSNSKTKYGPIEVSPMDFLITVAGQTISTTPTQFRLLTAFITHQEQLLSREWLKNTVWSDAHISPRTVDAQISKLKKIIPFLDKRLINIYGKGYILTEDQNQTAAS